MKFLVNDVSYHVEVCGEGFPMLMLHGFTGRGSNWSPFCTTLGKKSKLVMPDIIGHGSTETSSLEDDKYYLTSVAKDFIKVIDELGFEKIDILGYSMGGRLAIAMAILFPERVRKLVLESASPGLKTDLERNERRKLDAELARTIIENGVEAFVDYWEDIPLFESQKFLSLGIRASIRAQRLMNDPKKLGNSLMGMGTGVQPSFWNRLQEIEADVLMIVGDLDHKFCQIAEDMQKYLKKGKIYKVKCCGHAIHVEEPEKFGTIVSEFLSNT